MRGGRANPGLGGDVFEELPVTFLRSRISMIWIRLSREEVLKLEMDRKAVFIGLIRAGSQDGKFSVPDPEAHDTRRAVRVSETG